MIADSDESANPQSRFCNVGRDFKIGLMSGVVLGFVALIWVATRPSQSPQARMLGPSTAASQEGQPRESVPPLSDEGEPMGPTGTDSQPDDSLPPGLIAAKPDAAEELFSQPNLPASRQPVARRAEAPDTTRDEGREKITTTRFHIVQNGETLSGISQQYYGSAGRWRHILEANQETIKDPDKISPGTKLVIPD
jgi:nucleoid-associated protein YgaU